MKHTLTALARLFRREAKTGDMWGEVVDGKHLLWIYHGWWHGWVQVTAAGDYRLPQHRDRWYAR